MDVDAGRVDCAQDRLCSGDFRRGAVSHYQKTVGFQRGFVLDHAVLWHADTKERGGEGTYPADQDGILETGNHDRGDIPQHDNLSDNGNGHEHAAQEQAPEATPKCSSHAPEFHPISGVVESDDFLVGVVTLADNTEIFHFEAGGGELLDRGFRCGMVRKDGNDSVGIFHLMFLNGKRTRVSVPLILCSDARLE
jgi:hypothetical protein